MAVHQGPYRGPRRPWGDRPPARGYYNPAYPSGASSVMNDAFNSPSHFQDGEELITVTIPRYLLNNLLQEHVNMSNANNTTKSTAANDAGNNPSADAEAQLREDTVREINEQIGQAEGERRTIDERIEELRQRRDSLNSEKSGRKSKFASRFAKIAVGTLAVGAAVFGGVVAYKRYVAA